jgi:hypothetical protein
VSSARTYGAADLIRLLSAALGVAQATQVVDEAMRRANVGDRTLDEEAARRVLSDIASQAGLVGITGRVALSRLHLSVREGASSGGAVEAVSRTRRPLAVIARLLSSALGEERASDIVREAAVKKSIALNAEIDIGQALAILELLAGTPGVVGAAARFAKSRIHLSW